MRDAVGKRLGEYSKGMRQKLALIRAMLHDPPVLLLDEPTSAMDPAVGPAGARCHHSAAQRAAGGHSVHTQSHRGRTAGGQDRHDPERPHCGDMARRRAEAPAGWDRRSWSCAWPSRWMAWPSSLRDLVQVVAAGPDWLRYHADQPQAVNPQVLQRLAARQVPVVTLSEVPRSLEDVYLQVVGANALASAVSS